MTYCPTFTWCEADHEPDALGHLGAADPLALSTDAAVVTTLPCGLDPLEDVGPLLLLRLEQQEVDKNWVLLTAEEALLLADRLRAQALTLLDAEGRLRSSRTDHESPATVQ